MPTGTKVNLDIIYSNGERESASFIVPNGEQGPVGPVGPAGQVQFARLGVLKEEANGTLYSNPPIYEYNEHNIYTKTVVGEEFTIHIDKPGFYDVEMERTINISQQINDDESVVFSCTMALMNLGDELPLHFEDSSSILVNASTISANSYHSGSVRHKMSVNVTDSGYNLYSLVQSVVYNRSNGNLTVITPDENSIFIKDRIFITHYPEPNN